MHTLTAHSLWLEELQVRSCSPATLTTYTIHTTEAIKEIATFVGKEPEDLLLEEVTRDSLIAALSAYRSRPDKRTGKAAHRSVASVSRHLASSRPSPSW